MLKVASFRVSEPVNLGGWELRSRFRSAIESFFSFPFFLNQPASAFVRSFRRFFELRRRSCVVFLGESS